MTGCQWAYYLILLLTAQFFIGMQTSYSIVKINISEELSVSQEFFGVIEMVNMIGKFIGVFFLVLAPIQRIKKTYFIFLIIQVISYLMLISMHLFPNSMQALFPISMLGIGIGRGIYMFPYLLLFHAFNGHEDATNENYTKFNIWYGLMFLGHIWAILIELLLVDTLKLNWSISLLTFTLSYLFTGILTCAFVPESDLDEQENYENETLANKICLIITPLKDYLKRNLSVLFLLIQFCFLDNQTSLIVFWMPFFLDRQNLKQSQFWIISIYPIGFALGTFIINPLLRKAEKYISVLTLILLFLSTVCLICVLLLEMSDENVAGLIALLGFSYMFFIAPFSRMASTDIAEKCANKNQKYLAINFMRMIKEILAALMMLIVGLLMEIDSYNFLYILVVNQIIGLILHGIRRIREKVEKKRKQKKDQKERPSLIELKSQTKKSVIIEV